MRRIQRLRGLFSLLKTGLMQLMKLVQWMPHLVAEDGTPHAFYTSQWFEGANGKLITVTTISVKHATFFCDFLHFFRDVCTFCAIFGILQVVYTVGTEMTIVLKGCDPPANAHIYH